MLIINIVRCFYPTSQTGHWAEMVLVLPVRLITYDLHSMIVKVTKTIMYISLEL